VDKEEKEDLNENNRNIKKENFNFDDDTNNMEQKNTANNSTIIRNKIFILKKIDDNKNSFEDHHPHI